MLYAHSLLGHPHPASRTLSMSPPGMELLHTPRITSKSTLSLEILFSTSPDAVKLLQQTPSSLTPLLLIQVNKLKTLNHVLVEEYQITHILASLPRIYSSAVEQVKIDRRTGSTLITMDKVMYRLKERYLQLKREHGWSEDEMGNGLKCEEW